MHVRFFFYMHSAPQYRAKVESLMKKKATAGCIGEPQLLEAVKVCLYYTRGVINYKPLCSNTPSVVCRV